MPVGVRAHKLVLLVCLQHLDAAVLVVLSEVELLLVRILLTIPGELCRPAAKVLSVIVGTGRDTLRFSDWADLLLGAAVISES